MFSNGSWSQGEKRSSARRTASVASRSLAQIQGLEEGPFRVGSSSRSRIDLSLLKYSSICHLLEYRSLACSVGNSSCDRSVINHTGLPSGLRPPMTLKGPIQS